VQTVLCGAIAFLLVSWLAILGINFFGNRENTAILKHALSACYAHKEDNVDFTLDEKSYYEANLLYNSRNPVRYVPAVYIGGLLVISLFLTLISWANIFTYAFILICVYYLTYPYVGLKMKIKKMYAIQENLQKSQSITCTGAKFLIKNGTSSAELAILYDFIVNNRFILMMLTPQTFVCLPKSVFKDEEQFNYFLQTAYSIVSRAKDITV
jgi:hypothetical protein